MFRSKITIMTTDDPLSAFLNNASGGQPADDDPLKGDMLSGLLQGLAGGPGQGADAADNPFGGLMAGLLGGSPDIGSSGSSGGMGNLLGTLLGGMGGSPDIGSPASAGGGLGDLLSMVLGGGAGGGMGQAALLAPLADSIAAKAGIPRDLAMAGLTFLLSKLNSQQGGGAGGRSLSLEDMSADSGNMTAEFAAQAGIDEKTAEETLNALMLALSSAR